MIIEPIPRVVHAHERFLAHILGDVGVAGDEGGKADEFGVSLRIQRSHGGFPIARDRRENPECRARPSAGWLAQCSHGGHAPIHAQCGMF